MRLTKTKSIWVAFLLVTMIETISAASALVQKRSDITMVPNSDPAMARAKKQAHEGVEVFLKHAAQPPKGTNSYVVKLKFEDKNGLEFMWLAPFRKRLKAPGYEGILVNRPGSVKMVKQGALVGFSKKDIVDWGYKKNGLWYGHFTTCAMFAHMPKSESDRLKKIYTCKTK